MANGVWNGGPTVAIDVHDEPPCGRYWNSTVAVSASLVAESVGAPEIAEPGLFSVGVGAWLSTVTVIGAESRRVAGRIGRAHA